MKAVYRFRRFAWLGLLCLLISQPLPAADNRVTLNFVNADIESVLKAYVHLTGRNFIIDPRVKGTINIVSEHPVNRQRAYQLLLGALRMQGYAAVENGDTVRIVPEADAKQQPSGLMPAVAAAHADGIVTQVYPLHYESATNMVSILRPLISPNNTIAADTSRNLLVITDYAENLKRLDQILATMDRPNSNGLTVIPVHHASVLDLAQTLNKLMLETTPTGKGGEGLRLTILPDTRTNSLLVWTDQVALLDRVRSLAATLDRDTHAAGNMHVVYLRNAEAVKLAETLRGLLTGSSASTPDSSSAMQDTAAKPAAASSNGLHGSQAPTAATNTSPAAAPAVSGTVNGSRVSVQADAASNALIITAPEPTYNALRGVINKLDARPAQVYIEALIAEVTSDKLSQLGIQWLTSGRAGSSHDGAFFAGSNFNAHGSGNNILDVATGGLGNAANGLNVGYLRGQLMLPGTNTPITNLGMLAQAFSSDSQVNVLSTPNILTLDNQEASIIIGQNVPFITGSYAQAATGTSPATVNPFQTIERQDVGLTLKVKPQIAEGGSVRLKIYQEVSSIQDSTNAAGIITNKRAIDSTVMIDDRQIIVLGGLMEDNTNATSDGIPGLSKLPLIGGLFKSDSRHRVKTNLMVFLRPYVMRSDSDYSPLTQSRYDYIRNQEITQQPEHRPILGDFPTPVLSAPIIDPPLQPPYPAPSATYAPPADADEQLTPSGLPPMQVPPRLPPLLPDPLGVPAQ